MRWVLVPGTRISDLRQISQLASTKYSGQIPMKSLIVCAVAFKNETDEYLAIFSTYS